MIKCTNAFKCKKKKCDENLVLGNTYNGKTYCWQVNTRLMFKFLWEMIFFKGDMEVFKAARNKLFATNEKQINNYTLTLDTLHSCMSVVYTYQ